MFEQSSEAGTRDQFFLLLPMMTKVMGLVVCLTFLTHCVLGVGRGVSTIDLVQSLFILLRTHRRYLIYPGSTYQFQLYNGMGLTWMQ